MLTWKNMIALRMERQCLNKPVKREEYDLLYRDLSPGLNVHWHGFGQPPCLVYRTDFDDVEYNGRRQKNRQVVKGRFQKGNIGFIEASQMELFSCLYQKPYKPTEHSELVYQLIQREGPMNIQIIKEMTGLLVKQITPALHRLQESFLVFEDQNDGEWDRGWYLFAEMFPHVNLKRFTKKAALKQVLQRLQYRYVYLTVEMASHFYGLPKKEVKEAMAELLQEGILTNWQEGYLLCQDASLLSLQEFFPVRQVLALHRNDPVVRFEEYWLKECYKSGEKGTEVMQYLLIDGEIRGAVLGHFRYGPYDLYSIWLELSEEEAFKRWEEILQAVYEPNGVREEAPIFLLKEFR